MFEATAVANRSVTLSSIIAGELRPLARRIDAEGIYPTDILRRLGEAGVFAHHTQSHGPGPAGMAAAIEAMADIGTACLSTAFCTWCQDALVWYLDRSDNPAPRARYLAAAASGRRLGGTGLSNPMKFFFGMGPLALQGVPVPRASRVTW